MTLDQKLTAAYLIISAISIIIFIVVMRNKE